MNFCDFFYEIFLRFSSFLFGCHGNGKKIYLKNSLSSSSSIRASKSLAKLNGIPSNRCPYGPAHAHPIYLFKLFFIKFCIKSIKLIIYNKIKIIIYKDYKIIEK